MSMPALFKGRLSIPVIGAPLFIISVPDLVIAQCKAGSSDRFGAERASAGAARRVAGADQGITCRTTGASRPAVGAVRGQSDRASVEQPARAGSRGLRKHKVPMMITLGAREELNQAAHGWGCIVFHDVINQKFAHKAIGEEARTV
jgi:nitronate monooxygenase